MKRLPAAGIAVCSLALLAASAAFAERLEVGPGQPYRTVQSCLNDADEGDICNVHAGSYSENVRFKENGVTLQVNPGDRVILNGSIDTRSYSFSVVDGFEVTNFTAPAGAIRAFNATGGIIRNNIVHDGTGVGIYVRRVTDFQVYGNTVHDISGGGFTGGDGIVSYATNSLDSSYARGVRIFSNEVYRNHQDGINIVGYWMSIHDNYVHDNIYADFAAIHPDGIECNGSVDSYTGCVHTLVYNNVVKNQNQNIYFNGLGIPAENSDIWIFNNVVLNDPASSTGVSMAEGTSSQIILNAGTSCYILNNTVGGTVRYFDVLLGDGTGGNDPSAAFTKAYVQNNIIASSLNIGLWTYPATNVVELDHNLYYGDATAIVHWGASANLPNIDAIRSATGMEMSGLLADPLLDAFPAPTPRAKSPAIGAGANLSGFGQEFLNFDKNGNPRPSTGAWDIGALSYGSRPARPEPPANVTGTAR